MLVLLEDWPLTHTSTFPWTCNFLFTVTWRCTGVFGLKKMRLTALITWDAYFLHHSYSVQFIISDLSMRLSRPIASCTDFLTRIPQHHWNQLRDPLPYYPGAPELIIKPQRPCKLEVAHKPTQPRQRALIHVKDPLSTRRRRHIVQHHLLSMPSAYVS